MQIPFKAKELVYLNIQALRQIKFLPLISSDGSSDLACGGMIRYQKLLISLNSMSIEIIQPAVSLGIIQFCCC